MKNNFIDRLEANLKLPLPGLQAQAKMAFGDGRLNYDLSKIPKDVRPAGVLVHLYIKNEEWYLTLMRRTDRGGRHGGQVSFPGGGLEDSDKNLSEAALREANEEVGILPKQVTLLGELTNLYIPVSNSMVYPFVGYSLTPPNYDIDPMEVKEVIEVPLAHLQNPSNIKKTSIPFPGNIILKNVPYFDVFGNVVWGATAMMLSEFLEILEK